MAQRFIGIDLAWKVDGNHTGIAILEGGRHGAELLALSEGIRSLDALFAFVARYLTANTVIAVDAPLVATNPPGTARACERAISKVFGAYGASCHVSNRDSAVAEVTRRLRDRFSQWGIEVDFELGDFQQRHGRWLFEVYPHPALIRLFSLPRRLLYKKGRVSEKRAGQRRLQGYLRQLTADRPGLVFNKELREFLALDVSRLRGGALKENEDQLDALLCAYLAWHAWRWGPGKNEAFGRVSEGRIIVPRR
jgi:predicted RNase H-like nuclease